MNTKHQKIKKKYMWTLSQDQILEPYDLKKITFLNAVNIGCLQILATG
jgi:hypothetical protein